MGRLAFLLLFIVGTASAQGLRVGVAAVDITPPVGAPLAGYYTNREATGIHDPLHAKAMVIDVGGTKVAIVACDLVCRAISIWRRGPWSSRRSDLRETTS
jgi:neutral ceramidase